MGALSLLLRAAFARTFTSALLALDSVSVHHHCIDAEIKRLTD